MMGRLNKTVHVYAAGVIIKKDEKFLLVQEKSDFVPEIYGKWNFPMGRMEKGERPYRCALREGGEETGLLIKIVSKVSADGKTRPYRNQDGYNVKIGAVDIFVYLFEANIIMGEIKVPKDLLDVRWFSLREILDLKEDGKLIDRYIISAIADYNDLVEKRKGSEPRKES